MQIGQYNDLKALRFQDPGAYLSDGENEVLLPHRFVPRSLRVGDEIRVFVYTDSEDRPVATTQTPKATVGEFANLHVVSTGPIGAFVDWGLDKDLLVPFAQQRSPLFEDKDYLIRVAYDAKSGRVIGSTKLTHFLSEGPGTLQEGQSVDLIVYRLAPHGAMAIIERTYFGLIPAADIVGTLHIGDHMRGFVKKIREDGKIALALSPVGYRAVMGEAPKIVERLRRAGGFLPYSDSSSPEEIRREFGLSKGAFKKLIGGLMRDGQLEITHHGIRLVG